MKHRRLLIVLSVVLVVLAGGAIAVYSYMQSLAALPPLTITFSTEVSTRPEGSTCFGGDDDSPGVAKEILNAETDALYIAGGPNPMPDDVWAALDLRLPFIKNSTRHLLFEGSCFFRSPDAPADCAGDACFTTETLFDYTWLKFTSVAGADCFPDPSGCSGQTVEPGYVSISTIAKCHEITFEGPIYDLTDNAGNRYVMHATADGQPTTEGVVLPDGWTLEQRTLDEPLVVQPRGGNACYHNILRDNLVQSYHQYAYAGSQYPPG